MTATDTSKQTTPQVTLSADWTDSSRQWSNEVVDVTELPSLSLLVHDHRGPIEQLQQSIRHFVEQRKQLELFPNISRTFSLNYRRAPDADGNWHIGIAAEIPPQRKAAINAGKLAEGFRLHLFGAGEYARLRLQGGEAGLMLAAQWLIEHWLPQSAYEMAEGIVLFERLQFPPFVEPEQALVDILVPVEARI
ncbi:AraC family transcriptional regulator [Oceanobacter mangrovi]|uniref:AraC family transcriptional regulator n=1 Tax=Oceanobacter mangrovi TaxID=2862510 RepID=UPI001C8D54D6|nr:GyrI-like domain-containing protein [Oceanobacter mangrovi]